MKFDELNDDNYVIFAIKHYENPFSSTMEEFEEDLKRFKYIKRLLKKYVVSGELKHHLILNHMIICFNVFGEGAIPLLFYKIDKEYWSLIPSRKYTTCKGAIFTQSLPIFLSILAIYRH